MADLISEAPESLWIVTVAMKFKKTKAKTNTCSLEDKLWHTSRQCIKKQRRHFVNKIHIVKAMLFSSSYVQM